jgi:hypothetical protein
VQVSRALLYSLPLPGLISVRLLWRSIIDDMYVIYDDLRLDWAHMRPSCVRYSLLSRLLRYLVLLCWLLVSVTTVFMWLISSGVWKLRLNIGFTTT